jgi:hypothetical protein
LIRLGHDKIAPDVRRLPLTAKITYRSVVLFSLTLLFCSACIVVPVRVPELSRNAAGVDEHLDFAFLKAGITTRGEVTKNLEAIDTRADERFFWGRWQSSKWYVGGGTIGAGGGDRVWATHNILIQFDPQDLVREWVIIDSKTLDSHLDELNRQNAPALSIPISLPARRRFEQVSGQLALKSDSIEYSSTGLDLTTARANVEKLTSADLVDSKSGTSAFTSDTRLDFQAQLYFRTPVEVHYVQQNKSKTYQTKVMHIVIEPRHYLVLRRYFLLTTPESR